MISLLKFLDGPWDQAKGYLRDDLDHLESALNQRWGATFGDSNLLNVATTVTGTLGVDHGGTGAVSFTAHGVVLGEGTSPLGVTAAGTTGNALIGVTGADPVYGKIGLTTHVSGTLPVANGGTGATTLLIHGILLGNTVGAVATTAVGATGTVLVGNTAADPSFSTSVSVTSGTFSSLTNTRVVFAGVGGLLSDDADMTFVTDTLTTTKIVGSTSINSPSIVGGTLAVAPTAVEGYFASTSATDPAGLMTAQYSTNTTAARLFFLKGRGTEALPTIISNTDVIGRIRFLGYDGANYLQMAGIDAIPTPSATIVATKVSTNLVFQTATNATPSVLTTALTLDEKQRVVAPVSVQIGTSIPNNSEKLYVYSSTVGIFAVLDTGSTSNLTTCFQFLSKLGAGQQQWQLGVNMVTAVDFEFRDSTSGKTNMLLEHGTGRVSINRAGSVPTANLHIAAGTATASTAPLKFSSGTLLTTAEAGAIEFLTDKYYGTITTGAARKTFAFLESPVLVTPDIGAAIGTSLSLSNTINLITTGGAPTSGTLTMVLGTKTVNTTAATATCLIFFQRVTAGGTIGFATTYTKVNNTSFTVSSDSALDTSTYNWAIFETH